jgi:hypothetical protein
MAASKPVKGFVLSLYNIIWIVAELLPPVSVVMFAAGAPDFKKLVRGMVTVSHPLV